ncbi:MAG: hypothetical protein QOF83_2606 [Solirubrobacteraceae bacterium]|jgi:hypothetical protein|nr:hypothetical protein [Solirubrobacteraceae bacterium]
MSGDGHPVKAFPAHASAGGLAAVLLSFTGPNLFLPGRCPEPCPIKLKEDPCRPCLDLN